MPEIPGFIHKGILRICRALKLNGVREAWGAAGADGVEAKTKNSSAWLLGAIARYTIPLGHLH